MYKGKKGANTASQKIRRKICPKFESRHAKTSTKTSTIATEPKIYSPFARSMRFPMFPHMLRNQFNDFEAFDLEEKMMEESLKEQTKDKSEEKFQRHLNTLLELKLKLQASTTFRRLKIASDVIAQRL